MQNVSRRSFVKSAALGSAAVAAVVGCVPAYGDEAAQEGSFEKGIEWNGIYDVVVVGLGTAGEAAAIEAARAGAAVLVLEKAPDGLDGGNSRYCHQLPIGVIEGHVEDAKTYYRALRGEFSQPTDAKIDATMEEMEKTCAWFESLGAQIYSYEEITGGAFGPEYPELPGGDGTFIDFAIAPTYADGKMFKFLKQQVVDNEAIDLWFEAPATDLIRDPESGVVIGVTAQVDGRRINIRARNGVVMACGGFENNAQMLEDYAGIPQALPVACHFNTGDGHLMCARIGAQLSAMYNVAAYINCLYDDGMTPEWESGTRRGGKYTSSLIYVGGDGTRFMNENFKSRHGRMMWHGDYQIQRVPRNSWCVFDEKARQETSFSNANPAGSDAPVESGLFRKADTLEELAQIIDVPAENLVATVQRFNDFCAAGEDPEFHRNPENMKAFDAEGPYYAFQLVQSILNTQGGPYHNENAQILDTDGNPIPHLYGAGEFGAIYTSLYQGGGNVGEGLATGRIAGRNAAAAKEDGQPAEDLPVLPFVPTVEEPVWEAGENQYVGVVDAHAGDLVVRVTMDGDAIGQVEVLHTYDTPNIGAKAIDQLAETVVGMTAEQVAEVDVVSHATWSSEAFKAAIAAALA